MPNLEELYRQLAFARSGGLDEKPPGIVRVMGSLGNLFQQGAQGYAAAISPQMQALKTRREMAMRLLDRAMNEGSQFSGSDIEGMMNTGNIPSELMFGKKTQQEALYDPNTGRPVLPPTGTKFSGTVPWHPLEKNPNKPMLDDRARKAQALGALQEGLLLDGEGSLVTDEQGQPAKITSPAQARAMLIGLRLNPNDPMFQQALAGIEVPSAATPSQGPSFLSGSMDFLKDAAQGASNPSAYIPAIGKAAQSAAIPFKSGTDIMGKGWNLASTLTQSAVERAKGTIPQKSSSSFKSEMEVEQALKSGKVKYGDKIKLNGKEFIVRK